MAHAAEGSTSGQRAVEDAGEPAVGTGEPVAGAGRPPDFLIVGHQKCGTTALYEMLQHHPRIYMPAEKEPRFFIEELRPVPRADGRRPKRPATEQEYLRLFAGAGADQLAGEASPQYLRYPEVPAKIAELAPKAKIIALLREPADFLRSFHGQMLHNRIESEKGFRRAMELEPARRRGESFPPGCRRHAWLLYSEHIRYRQQLEWLHGSFPAEQVLVLAYEDYRRDNEAVVRQVLRFLQLDDEVEIVRTETAPLKDVRLQRLHHLSASMQEARRNSAAVSPGVRVLDAIVPGWAREALGPAWRRLIFRPRVQPDAAFVRELRVRFKPEVEAVSEYLDRDLVGLWGYDRLG